jgi:branched-chain amino acid transport system permease protein
MDFFVQQTVNGLALGAVFALYALGFSLVFSSMKAFHVAHAAVFTWAAVFAWKLTDGLHWGLAATLPTVVVLAGLLNVVTYYVAIRHLEHRRNRDLAIFISSLGAGSVLTALAVHVLHNVSVRLPFDLMTIYTWNLHIFTVTSIQVIMFGSTVVIMIFLRWLLHHTQFGREAQVVAHDRETAAMLGVNVGKVSALMFFLSGGLAGLGAVLCAIAFNSLDGYMGQNYLVLAITILVIGGLGSVAGGFAGGLVVGLISSYTTGYITSSYRDVVVYGILILFLIVRPTGLFKSANVLGRA